LWIWIEIGLLVPAVGWNRGDRIDAAAQQPPVLLRGANSARESATDSHDGDGFRAEERNLGSLLAQALGGQCEPS
jgi:hypothetical protein